MTESRSHRYHDGLAAEDAVARHYEAQGYTCLEKRWRCAYGEIDLICRSADTLVFIEVKMRRNIHAAAHAISAKQWARIAQAAQTYVSETGIGLEVNMRFDAALTDRHANLEIIENAAIFDS